MEMSKLSRWVGTGAAILYGDEVKGAASHAISDVLRSTTRRDRFGNVQIQRLLTSTVPGEGSRIHVGSPMADGVRPWASLST